MKSAAAIVLGLTAAACSHDLEVVEKTEQQSIDNAQATMGFYIPEDQDWKMTTNATANFSVAGANDETYTVKIYSNNLFEDGIGYVIAKRNVQGGQNFTAEFAYPSYQTSLYVGLTDSKGNTTYKVADIVNGQLTSLSDINSAARTRAENKKLNQWGDPNYGNWKVPDALSDGQKTRVMAYFQANPGLTYEDPHLKNFFIQQVYKGGTTPGAISSEQYTQTNGTPLIGSENMDWLYMGTGLDHVNDYNKGTWNDGVPYEVLNTGANTNDHKGNTTHVEGVTHPDMITLMENSSTEFVAFGSSTGNQYHKDCCALAGWRVIEAWAIAHEDSLKAIGKFGATLDDGWDRSFVGLDYENRTIDNLYSSKGNAKAKDFIDGNSHWVLYNGTVVNANNFADFDLKDVYGNNVRYVTDNVANQAIADYIKYTKSDNTVGNVTKDAYNYKLTKQQFKDLYNVDITNGEDGLYNLDMIMGYIRQSAHPTENNGNWVKNIGGRDYVFSDWIVTLTKAEKNGSSTIIIEEDNLTYSYAFEDNKTRCDFDLNDVVLRVKVNESDDTKFDVTLVAAGCEYDNYVFLGDQLITWPNGSEVHDALGADKGEMVNTGKGVTKTPVTVTIPRNGNNPEAADFKIWPYKKGGVYGNTADQKETTPILIAQLDGRGKAPVGIIVPGKWAWPTERTIITEAYSQFVKWASNAVHVEAQDWYKYPTSSKVVVIQ